MNKTFLAALAVMGMTATAQAAPVSFDVDLIGANDNTGNFVGTTLGTITISYDDADDRTLTGNALTATVPGPAIPGLPALGSDFDFTATLFGQTFTDVNDPNAILFFDLDTPSGLSLAISELEAGSVQPIDNPLVLGFATIGGTSNFFTDAASGRLAVNVAVNDVPLPAGGLMLISALVGAGAIARRRAKA